MVACRILPNDRTSAVLEFADEKCVKRLLSTPYVRLCGASLSLKEVRHSLLLFADEPDYNNEIIDQLLENIAPQSVPTNLISPDAQLSVTTTMMQPVASSSE